MNVRLDADLWKRFERAADISRQIPDDLLKAFMNDYTDRHLFDKGYSVSGTEGKWDTGTQIDLEDLLLASANANR
jgi:hypothetical protein